MKIVKENTKQGLIIKIEGRIDTVTSPELEKEINELTSDVKDLVLDMEKVEYVSSAGLRVILSAQKIMSKVGSMKLVSVCETVMEVFEITGFSDILTIE